MSIILQEWTDSRTFSYTSTPNFSIKHLWKKETMGNKLEMSGYRLTKFILVFVHLRNFAFFSRHIAIQKRNSNITNLLGPLYLTLINLFLTLI